MKLPRWLVLSMLSVSVLTALAAGALCLVGPPAQTAREFADLVASGNFEAANLMMKPPQRWQRYVNTLGLERIALHDSTGGSFHASEAGWRSRFQEPKLVWCSVSAADLLLRRRRFRPTVNYLEFTAAHGSISFEPIFDYTIDPEAPF